jgi:hypothetical protein
MKEVKMLRNAVGAVLMIAVALVTVAVGPVVAGANSNTGRPHPIACPGGNVLPTGTKCGPIPVAKRPNIAR